MRNKIANAFKKQQAKWEEAVPFGNNKAAPKNGKRSSSEQRDSRDSKNSIVRKHRGSGQGNANVPECVARASMIMPQLRESELADLPMASAKPSAIRAAARGKRIATRAETVKAKERQSKATEQQMKMQRYRDEIAAIKKDERAKKKAARENELRYSRRTEKILNKDVTDQDENAVLGYEDFASDDTTSSDEDDDDDGPSLIQTAGRTSGRGQKMQVLNEMKGSFRQLNLSAPAESSKIAKKPPLTPTKNINSASLSLSLELPRQREYRAEKGRLRQAPRRRSSAAEAGVLKIRDAPPPRQGSTNLVPEMRRRATQRDLFFDDADVKIAKQKDDTKEYKGTAYNKQKMLDRKQQKEKQQVMEQKKKLDEAEAAFKRGHNLCWQIHDSAKALGEYRTALFIRESLLGKYHEQTGRTYFWIGKSLVKLKEYAEALVAFSRALRIFERLVRKEHKYFKWTVMAIDVCIKEMDDGTNLDAYKARLNASIRFEREGDVFRKQKDFPEAIAKYRDAIDHVEEYHPDAADLYSKIALILRQDGDFERALEEYRFASEIYEMSLGADHPETIKALNEVMEKKRLGQLSNMLKNKLNLKT